MGRLATPHEAARNIASAAPLATQERPPPGGLVAEAEAREVRRGRRTGPLRHIRRPPRVLAALLGASFLLTLAWSLLIPPFHAPDEDEHYVYVQSLAENFKLPPHHSWSTPGPQLSPAVRMAEGYSRTRSYWLVDRGSARPPWDAAAQRRYAAAIRSRAPSSSHVDSAAYSGTDPPLTDPGAEASRRAGIAYRAVPTSNVFTRLFAMRVWTVPLVLLTVLGAWLLAGELFGPNRPLQLVAAATVGFQPMITFMSSGVNPDAAAYSSGAFVLWLGVRALRREPDRANIRVSFLTSGCYDCAMARSPRDLLHEALELPLAERAKMAADLLDSLHNRSDRVGRHGQPFPIEKAIVAYGHADAPIEVSPTGRTAGAGMPEDPSASSD